jgi:hypothetical protein
MFRILTYVQWMLARDFIVPFIKIESKEDNILDISCISNGLNILT